MNIQTEIENYQSLIQQSLNLLCMQPEGTEERFIEETLYMDSYVMAFDKALTNPLLPDDTRLTLVTRKIAIELMYAHKLNSKIENSSKEDLVEQNIQA